MKFCTYFKEGLVHSDCERFNPKVYGGNPPIRVIKEKYNDNDKHKDKNIGNMKIKISESVTKTYTCFKSGNAEETINLISCHKGILSYMKLKEKLEAALTEASISLAIHDNLEKEINLKVLASEVYMTKLLDAMEDVKTKQTAVKTLQDSAFDYFEKLLNDSVHFKWKEIIKEQCNEPGYVRLNGKSVDTSRGCALVVLRACYCQIMRLVSPRDATKRHVHYS